MLDYVALAVDRLIKSSVARLVAAGRDGIANPLFMQEAAKGAETIALIAYHSLGIQPPLTAGTEDRPLLEQGLSLGDVLALP